MSAGVGACARGLFPGGASRAVSRARTVDVMCFTRVSMAVADVGFLLYWTVTLLALLPAEYAYKDYADPVMSDWNHSFAPLDVAAAVTGLAALRAGRRIAPERVHPLLPISLLLSSVAGLQAVVFWTLRGDFAIEWWLPNLFLLLFPLPALAVLVRRTTIARP
ncbi:DUF5360 family protein [Embleya hyalina]|uniref:YvaD family protein n=1 Tax=Embleya hyalina TaxID=516124 RepID=A0A401YGA1_9ACTN|nr:DUF5360 family protein [Embleya hyalina]GCD93588.1 hypothetical protein EHYA_01233 [Embleya hyalina]